MLAAVTGQSVFDYNPNIPEVIPQIQRRFFCYPTGTYQQFVNSNDVIRFQFPRTKDFFDPWSLYFNGTINVPTVTGFVMQGAGSFNHIFSSVVFYDPTGRELERINGYNKLMEVLETVSYNPRQMQNMCWQGFGGTVDTSWGYQCGGQSVSTNMIHQTVATSGTATTPQTQQVVSGNILSTFQSTQVQMLNNDISAWGQSPTYTAVVEPYYNPGAGTTNLQVIGPYVNEGQYPWRVGPFIQADSAFTANIGKILPVDWTFQVGWAAQASATPNQMQVLTPMVGRLAYWHPLKSNAFEWTLPKGLSYDASVSTGPVGQALIGYGGSVAGGVPAPISMADAFWGTGFQLVQPLTSNLTTGTDFSSIVNNANTTKTLWFGTGTPYMTALASLPMIYGMAKPFNDNFCGSTMEPTFSTLVLTHYIQMGLPVATNYTAQSFKIPVMLGLIGHFIRKENYRLLPMEIFDGCTLEFTMNPTYLFTSIHTTNQQNRNYNLSNVYLEMETMIIMDTAIDATIRASLANFKLVSESWYQGPLFNVLQNNVPAEIQINLGFLSLRRTFFSFWRKTDLSTALREDYRLSHNLTSFYYLVGTTQWPNVPIQGQAGTNLGPVNNNDMYYQTLKAFNRQQNNPGSAMNPHNYSVNFSEFYPAGNNLDDNGTNQLCFFKENRCKGMFVAAVEFLSIMNQRGVFTGYDTSREKPWSLFLEYNLTNNYQGTSLFASFYNYDCVFMLNNGQWTVIGRN